MQVSCYTRNERGECGTPDTPAIDTKTFEYDHTPSITAVNVTSPDPKDLQGEVKFDADSAWTDKGLIVERLGGSSSPAFYNVPGSSGHYTGGFSAWPDGSGATMVMLTAEACSDRKTSTVVNTGDNECPGAGDASSGSSCPSCAGKPIRLANGNMRMTDRDALPGSDFAALTRTYDSQGPAGFFGNGWKSLFDANIRTYQSQTLGTQFVELRTAASSQYLFQNVGGSWLQMWPRGTTPAVLVRGAGTYTLREARSPIETTFDAGSGRVLRVRSRASGRDVVISYDTGGVPSHVADSWGNWAWTITSDAGNRIHSIIVDGTALAWTYNYDGGGNLANVTGPSGAAWRTYTYSGSGLTAAYDARGSLIEAHDYTYIAGAPRAISSVSDQDDITSIDYTSPGRDSSETLTRTTSGTGAITDYYTRFVAGRPRTVQVVGHCATCGTNDAVYAYDLLNGHLLREQDARGYITTRELDQDDRVTTLSGPYRPNDCDPASDPAHCRQTPESLLTLELTPTSSTLTTSYTYEDANWPEIATVTTTASVLVPGQVRTVAVQPDAVTGTITQQITTGESGNSAQPVQYTSSTGLYNGTEAAAFNPGGAFNAAWLNLPQPAGLPKLNDGPRTDVADLTTWVYYPVDTAVPATWRGHLAAVRNAAGHITRFENYDVFGNVGHTVDPNGVATESSYDTIGRLITSTLKAAPGCDTTADPLCATDIVTSRTYQPPLGPLASITTPRGATTAYEYDDRGRTTATTRQVSATAYERIEYDYDPATGHKSAERYLGGHPGAWTVSRSDAFQYDSFARLKEIDHPDGSKIVYHYDGANNLISVQDERHTAANTTYAYDPANRLASVTQTLSSAPTGQIATAHAYDVLGNLTSVTDPNGNVTSHVYDDFARMIRQTSPATGVTSYAYDAAGNLITSTDANAAMTTRTYDSMNRVLTAISSRDADTQQITWTYDDAAVETYGIGRLASAASDDSTDNYHYDRRGLLREEALGIEGDPFMQSYSYDADGNRTSITYPSGRIVNYSFDYAGRVTSVTGNLSGSTTPYVTSAAYLPFGPLTSLAFANGTTETRTFDQRYSPAAWQLSTASGLLANYAYAADAAGNITQIDDLTNSSYSRTFGYDDLNRLVTANSGGLLWGAGGYTYDSMGNMMSSTLGSKVRSFTYAGTAPVINTVSADGAQTSMHYDAAGNELNGPAGGSANFISDTRTYSARNLLQQVDLTAPAHYCLGPQSGETCTGGWVLQRTSTLWNGYDARGVRSVSMQSSSTQSFPDMKYYFYTPELAQLATFSPNEGIESDVIWFGGLPVASDTSGDPVPRFTFTDHLGTPILQTDALANVVWRAEYEPFGNVFAMRAGGANEQSLRFPGQQVALTNFAGDEENYNIFRWYRSGWGRYTQADPLAFDAFASQRERLRATRAVYEYSVDNPTRYVDRLGLKSCSPSCRVDCPGGNWIGVDGSISGGILFGKSKGTSVYFCTSSTRRCNFEYSCTTVGLQAGASVNVNFGGYTGCKCAAEIATTNSLSVGPIQLNDGGSGCTGGGYTVSYPTIGAQTVVGALCTTKLIGCMF
jgi:RHS repeat-associated protein